MAVLGAVPLLLCACGGGVLDPKGPVGAAERTLIFNALAIMLAIVVPVIVLTGVFAWWFRAGNTRAHYRATWAYSGRLELLVWSVPALAVLFLGGLGWVASHDLDPFRPAAALVQDARGGTARAATAPAGPVLEVQVVSLDWKWLFLYPEQNLASVNRLVVQAGTPVHFTLTSATVMNSFFVPQLGSQIYTMPGMTSQLALMADRPGRFNGMSAQFSGDGFSNMAFTVEAVDDAGFTRWVADTRARTDAPLLDLASYAALAKPGIVRQPRSFGSVEPGIFRRIVDMPTGQGDTASVCTAPRAQASATPRASFPGS